METSSTDTADLFVGRGWIVLLRGLTAVAFGVLALVWPHGTFARVVLLFGLYAMLYGILSVAAAIGSRHQPGYLLLAMEGVVGLWAGVATLRSSSVTPMAFVFFVWLWAVATGVLKIAEAIRVRKEISGDVWLALSGAVTVIFGVMLLLRHIFSVTALALLIAIFALIWGVCEILLGKEIRAMRHGHLAGSP